ncbi:MAG: cheBR [Rhizobacter sp.]|nr:cheBR [Rhizobacter sp.]
MGQIFRTLTVIEREVRSTDGRWFLVRLLPYRTSEDRIDGAILNLIDVTARREAEEQLHLSEQRMRMVAESMRDYAIITFDEAGTITSWNAGAQRIFGYSEAEAIGQPSRLIFTVEDRINGEAENEMRKAREKGRAEDDRWHLRKDGRVLFCSGIMTPLVDGKLVGYAKIARDLTQHKVVDAHRDAVLSAEKAVRSRLEEASVLKDEFLAIMSHELKNPLNLIQLNAELLLRLPQVREVSVVSRAATTIRSAVASQAQIIDDLLDLSRLNTGKFVLTSSHVDLKPVVERIVSAVHADATARQQSIVLSLQDGVAVYADPVRVEQIVWNLVTNAFKFTPGGGTVTITVSARDDMARFDVSDTGIGLEPDYIDQVFEMFRQVETGANRTRGGLGIGLALVKRLAELQGGRVKAASEGLGKGSTFSVWLPLDDKDGALPSGSAASNVLTGLRVLLVDDELETLHTFGELLGLEGALVTIVGSATEALARAMNESFDVILSDIAMPGHDGYWLIGKLRQEHRTSNVLTIAVSGMARPGDRLRALEAGFDSHLGKPLQLGALKDDIERLRAQKASA